MTQSAT